MKQTAVDGTAKDGGSMSVAIIGMAGRFPGSRNLSEFWNVLAGGRECISYLTDEELRSAGIDQSLLRDPSYVKARGLLPDAELFDPGFFGYSAREASVMDPQQRVFLEIAWSALEHSGYDSAQLSVPVAVFAGMSMNTYLLSNLLTNRQVVETVGDYQAMLGNDKDFLTTRVSYKLNLRGPSFDVQAACSTSLIAVHLACQSLLSGEADMALAGGVSISVPQLSGYRYQQGGIWSPDGHCRPFDTRAQGTVSGSGVGVVVLKRLDDALRDRDSVYAVIRGSAINNDGDGKISYTAPSVDGQASVIAEAMMIADVDPSTVTYVEAHGTATALGDPIEAAALTRAFGEVTGAAPWCGLGSVKSNIGHLDVAAGMAGLLKTVLAINHRQLPATLHFCKANPAVDFGVSAFFVVDRLQEWRGVDGVLRAGVSSFGIGGTNAHVILEQPPEPSVTSESAGEHIVVLSARSQESLRRSSENLREYFADNPAPLPDVSYTLKVGRRPFAHRRAVLCASSAEAAAVLETCDPNNIVDGVASPDRHLVFLFPGQGAQELGIGWELYRREARYREIVDSCIEILQDRCGAQVSQLICGVGNATRASLEEQLLRTEVTQPVLFTLQYALARFLIDMGVVPNALLGHSLGEYVAACIAGVMSLDSALRIVVQRAHLMQGLPFGKMIAATLDEAAALNRAVNGVCVAAINGPNMCVFSGGMEDITTLEHSLIADGIRVRSLRTSHAFHSSMMEAILPALKDLFRATELKTPTTPYLSNLTGTWVTPEQATDPEAWMTHTRKPVRFSDNAQEVLRQSGSAFVEMGSSRVLCNLLSSLAATPVVTVAALPRFGRQSEPRTLRRAVAQLWVEGVSVDWPTSYATETRRRVALPTYSFDYQRCWVDANPSNGRPNSFEVDDPETADREDIANWFYQPSWKARMLSKGAQRIAPGPWLLFASSESSHLKEQLSTAGLEIIEVIEGKSFEVIGSRTFAVRPDSAEDYVQLLKQLCDSENIPTGTIHCWLSAPSNTLNDADIVERGFFSLLWLSQAVVSVLGDVSFDLVIVSSGMHDVMGDETVDPVKSVALGPCRVIPLESRIRCRTIDIPTTDLQSKPTMHRLSVVDEILYGDFEERVVALRNSKRWTQCYEPVHIDAPAAQDLPLRNKGVYLVTGGMGGIGLTVAEYLASEFAARLILLGRDGLPPRSEWISALQGAADQRVCSIIKRVQKLESAGAEVMIVAADVTDEQSMTTVRRETEAHFGKINGIIHAAGVTGGGLFRLKGFHQADAILAPKVVGSRVLTNVFKGADLDFVVLWSSINAVTGQFGQIDYCAANSALGGFATAVRELPVIAIDWDGWSEVGSFKTTGDVPLGFRELREREVRTGMTLHEGLEAFRRALASRARSLTISGKDLGALIRRARNVDTETMLRQMNSPPGSQKQSRPSLSSAFVAPRSELEQRISEIWQELLGISKVGVDDDFMDLGGHSLLAVQMATRIREDLGLSVELRDLLEHTNIAGLAEFLTRNSVPSRCDIKPLDIVEVLAKELEGLPPDDIRAHLELVAEMGGKRK